MLKSVQEKHVIPNSLLLAGFKNTMKLIFEPQYLCN